MLEVPVVIGTEDPPATECICGITDSFTRTVASGWGTSDSLRPWVDNGSSGALISVDGTNGSIVIPAFGNGDQLLRELNIGPDYHVLMRFKMPLYRVVNGSNINFEISTPAGGHIGGNVVQVGFISTFGEGVGWLPERLLRVLRRYVVSTSVGACCGRSTGQGMAR